MACASLLPENKFVKYYDAIESFISSESNAMYRANNCKPGQYKGEWSRLFDKWLKDEIPNIYVQRCLSAGFTLSEYL